MARRFIKKPLQIIKRALRKPHISETMSLIIYEIGNTIIPAVTVYDPSWINLTETMFEISKQEVNSIAKKTKRGEMLFFI